MDRIIKAVCFGGKARLALIDTTEAVNKAIKTHDLSPLAAAALGLFDGRRIYNAQP